jgi:L-talarate/galactarate dehydratase
MKIKSLKVNHVRFPIEEPIVNAPPMPTMQRDFLTVQMQTDDGIEGLGVTGFGGRLLPALKLAVELFGEAVAGSDPMRPEQVNAKVRAASSHCGPGGIATLAATAIDTALWDIRGKALNQPVSRLLGGLRDKVPAYASGALVRTTPTDKLAPAAEALVKKGYTQIKTQMAVPGLTPAQEIERIRIIREAVGPDVNLMVDINERWGVNDAISILSRIEDVGLGWIEDPTVANDYKGLAAITAALHTPICAGERVYGIEPFQQLMTHRSADIMMIDLLRVGGITPWMKVAGMAEAFNMPVVSHLLPEIHVSLIAAVPNATLLEYMPWTWRMFENPPIPVNGEMTVPTGPGLGLAFAPDLFTTYGVS